MPDYLPGATTFDASDPSPQIALPEVIGVDPLAPLPLPSDPEPLPTCSVCDESEDDCECAVCVECHETVRTVCANPAGCRQGRRRTCGRCSDCCHCCSTCDTHEEHCECYTCDECGDRVASDDVYTDDDRSYCDGCWRARESDEETDDVSHGRPFIETVRGKRLRSVGVEWEYNSARGNSALEDWRRRWRAGNHEDASCGRELVTAPLSGRFVRECLGELKSVFRDARVQADERCGIHVHVDAKDLMWSDMYRLLAVYAHVEPILYALAGQHRVGNTYCAPCGEDYARALADPSDRKGAVLAVAFSARSIPHGKERCRYAEKKDGGRYKGLNVVPWIAGRKNRSHGIEPDTTVEFRLHRNTLDVDRVIGWTELCAAIVDYAARASDGDVRALPKSAIRALCTIAPDSREWILARLGQWRRATARKRRVTRRIAWRDGRYRILDASATRRRARDGGVLYTESEAE